MALNAGTVSVSGSGVVSGSGLAREMYDAIYAGREAAGYLPTAPTLGGTSPPWSTARPVSAADVAGFEASIVKTKQQIAVDAQAMATAIVAHIVANGHAKVTSESLGRIPASVDPSTPAILAPAAPVLVPLE